MSSLGGIGAGAMVSRSGQMLWQGTPRPVGFDDRIRSDFESALAGAGVDEADLPGILDEVESVFTDAHRQGTDARSVRDVIGAVLARHGVDIEGFDAAMKALRHDGPPPPRVGLRAGPPSPNASDNVSAMDEQRVTGLGSIIDAAG